MPLSLVDMVGDYWGEAWQFKSLLLNQRVVFHEMTPKVHDLCPPAEAQASVPHQEVSYLEHQQLCPQEGDMDGLNPFR